MKTSIHIPVLPVLLAAGFNFCSAQTCMVTGIPPAAAICTGNCITLNAMFQSSPPCPSVMYSWTPSTGLSNPNISNPVACPSASTTYTVGAMCLTTSCVATNTVSVTVNPLPIANAGPDVTVCAGGTLTLNGSGGTAYSWSGPNGFTSILQNPTIGSVTTMNSGTYTLTVTDANGCTNNDNVTVTVIYCTGVAENNFLNQISLFPNPFSESTIFRINDVQLIPCEFRIYNLLGREIKSYTIQNTETKITRENFSSGLYYYRLLQKGVIIRNGKLMIE